MNEQTKPAPAFEINERRVGRVTVLALKGRLALGEGSRVLNEKLQDLIEHGCQCLLLECSHVDSLDSQGISALVRGVISMKKRGGQLKLLSLSPRVRQVLEITRLVTVIESFNDEAVAIASF